jgi:conjugal transfer pilus assembly protein TraV
MNRIPPLCGCALALCAGALSGCASLSGVGGTSEFACKAPDGVRCDSVSGNYANALQHNLPSQQPKPRSAPGSALAPDAAPARAPEGAPPPMRSVSLGAPAPLAGDVYRAPQLRSQARILRLWYKPWEDADRDLYDQGYLYVQIDAGRWLIDHAQRKVRAEYAPIRPPRSASAPAPATQAPAALSGPISTVPPRAPVPGVAAALSAAAAHEAAGGDPAERQ